MEAGLNDLLTASIIAVSPGHKHSLPGLLAALARNEVCGFPAQRPHQRAAWHMFLVQLAALALWNAGRDDLPETEEDWRALLLALTGGDAGPWALTGPDDKPAFLQPPAPKGLNWTDVKTPDALDLLITSRNHDLKQQIARHAEPQDWVFALVSLQTMSPFGGRNNYGIARMSSSYSSRMLFGIAPALEGSTAPNVSRWWAQDVTSALKLRAAEGQSAIGKAGGVALLWIPDWPSGTSVDITKLDPWFIEVSRRVRLNCDADRTLQGKRVGSDCQRVAKSQTDQLRGAVGDLWAPIAADGSTVFNIGKKSLSYSDISDLLYGGNWVSPPLLQADPSVDDGLLIIEGIAGGQTKSFGWRSRQIPISAKVRGLFRSETAGTFARTQIDEIKVFDEALRNALALVAARGEYEGIGKAQYARTTDARARFDRAADALFFPALWDRLAAYSTEGKTGEQAAQERFVNNLLKAAKLELTAALPAIPCTAIYRPRAEARARRSFAARVRKAGYLPAYEKEPADV
jgi:CRISPR system Cascade subunit CasA